MPWYTSHLPPPGLAESIKPKRDILSGDPTAYATRKSLLGEVCLVFSFPVMRTP